MDVIADKLEKEAEKRETAVDKAKELVKRVKWLRALKLVAGSAAAVTLGFPPIGMLGDIWSIGERALGGGADDKLFTDVKKDVGEASEAAGGLLAAKADKSTTTEIKPLRDTCEETLETISYT